MNILEWRTFHSLTQAQAARIVGRDVRTWRRWEGGEGKDVPAWVPLVLAFVDSNPEIVARVKVKDAS